MKKIKNLLAVLLVLALGWSLLACSADPGDNGDDQAEAPKINTMQRIKDDNRVIWGTNAAFPPFEIRRGDEVIGVDAEIAKLVAEKLGVELVVEDMDFDALIGAMASGKIDFIAAGFTVRADREEQVLFTDKYFEAIQVIIVRDDNTDIQGPEDLAEKKIGVQNGTSGDFVAEDIVGDATDLINRYNNGLEAALELRNGRIDAIIIDNLPAQMIVYQNPGLKILETQADDEEEYALAVRLGDSELAAIINEVLAELKQSGQIDAWVEEYSFLD